jgi:predicted DsbA family dithiol-disulfide isomerase
MDVVRIPVYYDFASSLCYVAHRVMERMAGDLEEIGAELDWWPLDLTRITGWRRGDAVAGPRRDNALRVAAELGVPLRMPAHWPDSRLVLAAAVALADRPVAATWRERVWTAIYDEGRTLDSREALEGPARDLGLDVDELTAPEHLEALGARTNTARESEVTAVPAFMFNGWPIPGIQEEPSMRALLARFVKKARERSAAASS